MTNLYSADCSYLKDSRPEGSGIDIDRWSAIYKMISKNVSVVDRCNSLVMPYRFKTFEQLNMPRDLNNFSLTYEECCISRAQELVDLSRRISKPITIMYSGGIDSTCVLVSFMKILGAQELKERIRVALSIESIDENVNFYYDHIRTKCTIISSEHMSSLLDGSSIVVTGELNDQLFGSDIVGWIYKFGDYNRIHESYSRDFITKWMRYGSDNSRSHPIADSHADFWYDLLDNHIRSQAPCEVRTNFDFLWWYNFCLKWQNVYFRNLLRIDFDKRHLINDRFLNDCYQHFFSSTNFQKWSMLNPHLKIGADWQDYKVECKKFIFDYNHDAGYRDHKIKIGSLYYICLQKKTASAITEKYELVDRIDSDYFYQPNNSFI